MSFVLNSTRRWICMTCAARFSTRSNGKEYGNAFRKLKLKLPKEPARTRFAPSPTGYLHLGSLRTALFNYLLAKCTGGQFLLRIEDTDKVGGDFLCRTVLDAEEKIFQDLRWAGLQWDEGPQVGGPYGPYRQSERTEIYQKHAGMLIRVCQIDPEVSSGTLLIALQTGHAYRCFCSAERLNKLAKLQNDLGLPVGYDRACANISEGELEDRVSRGESHVVRLRVPNKYPKFEDLIYGVVGGKAKYGRTWVNGGQPTYEDPILLKSDGQPTYNLANVVDDHHMKITHVVRATEWLSTTPKHIFMYEAYGWQPPAFAHVGLLQDHNGQKLSKRNLDLDLSTFRRDLDIFPEALVNYVALLGWSHNASKDVMGLNQLVENFDLKFTKGNTIVTFEKLWFLQKAHAKLRTEKGGEKFEELLDRVCLFAHDNSAVLGNNFGDGKNLRDYVSTILRADSENFTTSEDFWERNSYFFVPIVISHYSTRRDKGKIIHSVPVRDLVQCARQIEAIPLESWNSSTIKGRISEVVAASSKIKCLESNEQDEEKFSGLINRTQKELNTALHHYLRWAIAEGKQGLAIGEAMAILGRDISLGRLREAAALADPRVLQEVGTKYA
ncbi:MAG: Glutamate--tRNA ligase mitochondrial [Geoglossum simile]|nr:MAG: Glutamate--tRNA ligase mitochondrial [Geoglossum simile]